MRRPVVWVFTGSVAGWLVVWLLLQQGRGNPSGPPSGRFAPDEKHYVTPRQLTAAGALAERRVAPFSAPSLDGRLLRWPDLAEGRPLALVFLKAGCPCNDDFEPFYQRLRRAYGDALAFAAVIDDEAAGRAHAQKHRGGYPILIDADRNLIRQFEIENGGYIVLLRADGALDAVWPGWSKEMFQQLGRRCAALAGAEERPLDVDDLPDALTTGCPYTP
jgi:hypothetical protein